MDPHWTIIANPISSGERLSREKTTIEQLLQQAGIEASWKLTEAPKHATLLAQQAIEAGSRYILVIGGDGTTSEVVDGIMTQNACLSHEVVLALIPFGTGNDWARMHGIPNRLDKAVSLLKNGQTHRQDIGKIIIRQTGSEQIRFFHNVMGVGLEAQIVEDALDVNKQGFWGTLTYLRTLLKTLFRHQPTPIRVRAGDQTIEKPILVATVGICRFNGAGMTLVPEARPNDGLFDITIVEEISPWNVIRNILKLYNGKIYKHPKAHHWRSASVSIEAQPLTKVEADGEFIGPADVEISLIPEALQFLGPVPS
jgi:diacylglycerol kinase (ATP)